MTVFLLLGMVAGIEVWARQDTVPGSRYVSARGSAMGDAFLPLPNDGAGALFYNPAAIGRLKGVRFENVNVGLEVNNDLTQMGLDQKAVRILSLNRWDTVLQENQRKYPGFGGYFFPNFYMKGIAFGALLQTKFAAQRDGDTVNYRSIYQFIPTAGFGFKLAQGILRFGYSLQWVNQTVARHSVDTSTGETLGYTRHAREGAGFSHNAGFAITFPFRWLPAFNIVARNIGSMSSYGFSLLPVGDGGTNLGVPESERMSIDASFSWIIKLSGTTYFNFVGQMRDATNTSGTALPIRTVGGVEFSFRDTFFLRGGYGSAYPSAGMGLKTRAAEFGLSWYSEELGTGFHDHRDIRILLQYQARIF